MKDIKAMLGAFLCAVMLMGSTQTAYASELDQIENPDEYVLQTREMESDGSGMAVRHSIMCHARLEPLNDYTILRARSYVDSGEYMDRMIVTCHAFYESGAEVGVDIRESPKGQTTRYYAEVKVPESPFPLKIYSGFSTHQFYRSGHKSVNLECNWKRES